MKTLGVEIGANPRDGRPRTADAARAFQGRRRAGAAVDEEPVVDVRHRVHGVDIGRQEERRLRLAGGDQPGGMRATERGHVAWRAQRGAHLGQDVEGVLVAWMRQRAVALRGRAPDTGRGRRTRDREQALAAHDSERLDGQADVDRAGPHDLLAEGRPFGGGVDPGGLVEPFDDDGPGELLEVRRPPDDQAGLVGGGRRRVDPPGSVGAQRAHGRVGGRRAGGEVLLLDVTVRGRVGPGAHRFRDRAHGDRPGERGRRDGWPPLGGRALGSRRGGERPSPGMTDPEQAAAPPATTVATAITAAEPRNLLVRATRRSGGKGSGRVRLARGGPGSPERDRRPEPGRDGSADRGGPSPAGPPRCRRGCWFGRRAVMGPSSFPLDPPAGRPAGGGRRPACWSPLAVGGAGQPLAHRGCAPMPSAPCPAWLRRAAGPVGYVVGHS